MCSRELHEHPGPPNRASRGISTGWTLSDGTSLYRPFEAVNRDAMAAFLFRLSPLL